MNTNNFDLLKELIKTSFKMRYQNSILGVLWVLIKPYSTFIVMYLVWTNLRGGNTGVENFALYLISGIVFYTYFSELISLGQMALLDKAGIILKVSFPRQIAIIAALTNALINLFINMGLIIIMLIFAGYRITVIGLLHLVLVIGVTFFLCLGISFFTSILTIKFRDLKNIFDLGLFLLYWLTPIFYVLDNSLFGDGVINYVIKFNPLGFLTDQFRSGLGIYGEIDLTSTMIMLIISLTLCILGWHYFKTAVKNVAEFF